MNESTAKIQYILDTDTVTYQQHGHERVVANLQLVNRDTVATTVITMYEQLRGRLAAVNRKQNNAQLQVSLSRLQATQHYFCTATILAFDQNSAQTYQTLVKQKMRIGTQDLRIAAIALAHNAILVTANMQHFSQVPSLQVEDWINHHPQ